MEKDIFDGITEENTTAMPTDSESNTDTAVAPTADTSADGNAAGNTANTNADGNDASTATVIIDDGDEDEIDPEEDWEDEDEDNDGITLSPAQQLAVDTRDKTLLVSAAAGSGKTFTLSRRILAAITKKDNTDKMVDLIDRELCDEKAVRIAIRRINEGYYSIVNAPDIDGTIKDDTKDE